VEIAMHCNLSPPDITPVVLVFNYEAIMHQPTCSKIPQPLPTHSALIQHSNNQSTAELLPFSHFQRSCFIFCCVLKQRQLTGDSYENWGQILHLSCKIRRGVVKMTESVFQHQRMTHPLMVYVWHGPLCGLRE